jgi:hypothetical protein
MDDHVKDAAAEAVPSPRKRANYLPPDCLFGLHHACAEIMKSYDSYGVYLVGSSIVRKDYRDVDLRCIMKDDVFEAEFPADAHGHRPKWMLTCLALSAWLKHVTGLPVDFQFQKQSLANAHHKGERHAMGYYHWRGDAT